LNEIIATRKKRWSRFLDAAGPQYMYLIHYDETPPPPELLRHDRFSELTDHARREFEKLLRRMEWLDEDRVPCPNALNHLTATEVFPQAFGCRVHFPENHMPCALPLVTTAAEASKLIVPRWEDTRLGEIFRTALRLQDEYGKDATFKLPDIQSPMGTAALIWEKSAFFIAMIEEPEAVKELAAKTKTLLFSFMDEWFRTFGKGFVTHWPHVYMPYGLSLSEDEIGSVSPQMFCEFFLPDLIEISERYGALSIHCCAYSVCHWDGFLKIPNLQFMDFAPKWCGASVQELYRYFANHAALYCAHGISLKPGEDFTQFPKNARLATSVHAATKDEALRLAEMLAASRSGITAS
jgi:hypothetical protein